MALTYNLGYQESISVHPTRRQNFAGKPYSNFPNIWEWLICNQSLSFISMDHTNYNLVSLINLWHSSWQLGSEARGNNCIQKRQQFQDYETIVVIIWTIWYIYMRHSFSVASLIFPTVRPNSHELKQWVQPRSSFKLYCLCIYFVKIGCLILDLKENYQKAQHYKIGLFWYCV